MFVVAISRTSHYVHLRAKELLKSRRRHIRCISQQHCWVIKNGGVWQMSCYHTAEGCNLHCPTSLGTKCVLSGWIEWSQSILWSATYNRRRMLSGRPAIWLDHLTSGGMQSWCVSSAQDTCKETRSTYLQIGPHCRTTGRPVCNMR